MKFFILVDHKPVEVGLDVWRWANWFHDGDRMIARTKVGDRKVETWFRMFDDPFFEVELFERLMGQFCEAHDLGRYSTWDEAIARHEQVVEKMKAGFIWRPWGKPWPKARGRS